ncbi:RlpA-like double-psi beta-barrel-protein domain-containing protein-containing protein [Phycomyces nitens]|nr:RlpA-like double-psi beta-barrel-protein domain-containing protein-containing protein [Phycomyces nitens]
MSIIARISFFIALFIAIVQLANAAPLEKRSYSGDGTFYGVGLGSCGSSDGNNDLVAALNAPQMGNVPNPNNNPNCGRRATVKGPKGTVTVRIVDTCPPCKKGDLDLSPAAFGKIADFDAGRVHITWNWA